MKTCTKCKQDKPLGLFYKRTFASGKKGVQSHCKACANKQHEQYVYKFLYGVDEKSVPPKPSVCQLCKRGGKICMDHCHDSSTFRGWLCDACNRGIGLLKDDPVLLRAAADYIEREK